MQTKDAVGCTWAGEQLTLFAGRGLYWHRARTLVIADTHFGKDAAMRSAGIAVPSGATDSDLTRLSALLDRTEAHRLLILGDFFHAGRGRSPATMDAVRAWREARQGISIINVRGNHDLRAGDPPNDWQIECAEEPILEPPFAWLHNPHNIDGAHSVGGHLHPAVVLRAGPARLKAVCFWFRRRSAVLPAFSEFTGMTSVHPRPGDMVFAAQGSEIVQVAGAAGPTSDA